MTATAAVSPRWTRRKSARPSEIRDAALELFVQQGFAKTRVEEIAQRAGVTAGAIYRYFPNKEAILDSLIRDSLLESLDAIADRLRQRKGKVTDMIGQALWSWWQLIGDGKLSGLAKLMVAEGDNFPALRARGVEDQQWEVAVACDKAEFSVRRHASRFNHTLFQLKY